MEISKEQLLRNALKLGISKEQAAELWFSLNGQSKPENTSAITKLLYYLGALIVILAMGWLITINWNWLGSKGIFLTSLAYIAGFTAIGNYLWHKRSLQIPGGLFITMAVCVVPLAIFSLGSYLGYFNQNDLGWNKGFETLFKSSTLYMSLGTIVAGLIALKYYAFPFLTAPIYFAAWFLIQEIAARTFGTAYPEWTSMILGLVVIAIAYITDLKSKKDYAFWGYFFGLAAFWIGLSNLLWDKGEAAYFIYLLISLAAIGVSLLLKQKIFLVYGGAGVLAYLCHLAYDIFKDSLLFPFVLSFIGFLVVYLGIVYQRNIAAIDRYVQDKVPVSIKRLLPPA